jgi:hypothetical protein
MADDSFEISRSMPSDLRDMSSIDAKDEFPFRVSRQRQFVLATLLRVNVFKEHALFVSFFQSLTKCQRAVSQGRVESVRPSVYL